MTRDRYFSKSQCGVCGHLHEHVIPTVCTEHQYAITVRACEGCREWLKTAPVEKLIARLMHPEEVPHDPR